MKRPEGFEPTTRRTAQPTPKGASKAAPKTPPASRKAQPSAKQQPKPQAKQQPRTPERAPTPATARSASNVTAQAPEIRTIRSPQRRDAPQVDRADREARTALRRAARERRRYERTEVKRFTRRARNRRIGWGVAGGVVVVLGAMLLIAVYSPILALQKVSVEGTSRIDAAQVQSAVADQIGTPLALIDFDEITAKLGAIPLIQSYVTETVPPNTLIIHVVERTPVAVTVDGSKFDLVDPAGVVIQTVDAAPDDLPIIDAGEGGSQSFTAAAEVLLGLPDDLRKRVGSISATTEDDVSFTFLDTNQKVIWGSSERGDQKATALNALIVSQKKDTKVDFNVSSPDIALVIDE